MSIIRHRTLAAIPIATLALSLLMLFGCRQAPAPLIPAHLDPTVAHQIDRRGDKTRDAFAKATETLKPGVEWSARKVGVAIEVAAQEALAAAEGVIEGWTRSPESHPVRLNWATAAELRTLPGITQAQAQNIVRNRPYRTRQELMTKAKLSEEAYAKIRDRVTTD